VEAVERCHAHLGRPHELTRQVAALAPARPVAAETAAALRVEGEALLAGLHLLGRLTPAARTAWRRAWHLLSEEVATAALAPFGKAPPGDGQPGGPAAPA
jgi:hypothetical protein